MPASHKHTAEPGESVERLVSEPFLLHPLKGRYGARQRHDFISKDCCPGI